MQYVGVHIFFLQFQRMTTQVQFENDMFCKGSERREKLIGYGHQLGKKNPYYATPNTKFTHTNNFIFLLPTNQPSD